MEGGRNGLSLIHFNFMKNTSAIIKDLLAIIERQEKELKLSTNIIHRKSIEIEQLKSSLKESERTNVILTGITNKSLDNGDKLVDMVKNKIPKGGNNFYNGNNN
jgi:hypothetical protein